MKGKDFNKNAANLGDTITYSMPPRFYLQNTLGVVTQESLQQQFFALTADKVLSVPYTATDQERIFNIDKDDADENDIGNFMSEFAASAVAEIGTGVERVVSAVIPENTFRYFGDGITEINSFQQLAQICAKFRNFGAAQNDTQVILPDIIVPQIIGTGLSQFATDRNNDIAETWRLGSYSKATFNQTNIYETHYAGNVCETGTTLTLVAVSVDGKQLTFTGAAPNDPDAVKANDLFTFQDGVPGFPNIRYLTYIGHSPSASKVQFSSLNDAASDLGGNVVINVHYPILGPTQAITQGLQNKSINFDLQAGMQVLGAKSHAVGVIYSGNALYLAMPELPDTDPFKSSIITDKDTGASMRLYQGFIMNQAQKQWALQVICGAKLVPEYAMRIAIPLSQV